MDHFVLPEGARHIRVLNATFETYSSGDGGFFGYPARKRWTPDEVKGEKLFGGRSKEKVQAFFQTWLYFGCAIEFFAVIGIEVTTDDFLDRTKRFVSTKTLPSIIRKWGRRVLEERSRSRKFQWAMKADDILRKVREMLDQHYNPFGLPQLDEDIIESHRHPWPVNRKISMSIIALGHTLKQALLSYFDIRRTASQWGFSTLLRDKMLQAGWCPMDVFRSLSDMGIDGHYYIASLPNPQGSQLHMHCKKSVCKAQDIDEKTYEPLHVEPGCRCDYVLMDVDRIAGIIESEHTPVVARSSSGEMHVASFIQDISDKPYITLSHVWADGMGNPKENSLYRCQIEKLQEMVDAVAESLGISRRPCHFWMDTLCIPVTKGKDLRKLSIRRMGAIYESAAAVLVLSSDIRRVPSTADEYQKSLAIYFANWNHRLWTFQEGILANSLFLQFKDKALKFIDDMEPPLSTKGPKTGHCIDFPDQAQYHCMVDPFFHLALVLREGDISGYDALSPLLSAIQFRKTSKLSDETLCLSTIMRMDSNELLEQKDDDLLEERRLEVFLKMVGLFPPDVIFNVHGRLQKDGFRWAPKSFLGMPPGGYVREVAHKPGILTERGLFITYPGVVIQKPPDPGWHLPCTFTTVVSLKGEEPLRIRINLIQREQTSWSPDARYALIINRPFHTEPHAAFTSVMTPRTIVEYEDWFQERNRTDRSLMPSSYDAVFGSILQLKRSEDGNIQEIHLRHECLAGITMLDQRPLNSTVKLPPNRDSAQNPIPLLDPDLTSDLEPYSDQPSLYGLDSPSDVCSESDSEDEWAQDAESYPESYEDLELPSAKGQDGKTKDVNSGCINNKDAEIEPMVSCELLEKNIQWYLT